MKNDHLLNIVDGTPVNTSWLKRIFTATSTKAVASVAGAAYVFNIAAQQFGGLYNASDHNMAIAYSTALAAASAYLPGYTDLLLEPTLKNKCFNSKPIVSNTLSLEDTLLASKRSQANYVMAGILIGYSMINGDPVSSIYVHAPLVFSCCLQGYRFNKVVNGEWSFDDTPPKPKKAPQPSLADRLKALKDTVIPQPLQPVPVPNAMIVPHEFLHE